MQFFYSIMVVMERIDDLQLKGLKIIQDTDLFCFGTDAVLLADFVSPKKNSRVADLGTGTGILPLLLYGRHPDITVDGLEIQEALCKTAQRSVELNGLEKKIRVLQGDIRNAYDILGSGYDIVMTNPPYDKKEAAIPSAGESHRIARFEVKITLAELCAAAGKILCSKGKFYMIHRASRLAEIFEEMRKHALEPKIMRCIHSFADAHCDRVLVCAVKDGKSALNVLAPLVVHNKDGSETEEVRAIYHREKTGGYGK